MGGPNRSLLRPLGAFVSCQCTAHQGEAKKMRSMLGFSDCFPNASGTTATSKDHPWSTAGEPFETR